METRESKGSLVGQALAGLRWAFAKLRQAFAALRRFDWEVATSPLGRLGYLAFALGAPMVALAYRITGSLRMYIAVVWIYGRVGYERYGIRYVGGRPPKFSDGSRVPTEVELFVGYLPFFVAVFGTVYLVYRLKMFYEARRDRTLPPDSPR